MGAFPQDAVLHSGTGESFPPGTDCFVPKGATCSITDTDGQNYGLFEVTIVDPDGEIYHGSGRAGGVLYFHSTPAIPPELGGAGVLKQDPARYLESCAGA